jgi:cytochrome b561
MAGGQSGAAGAAQRYSSIAIALHWIIAAAIVGQIALGFLMASMPDGLAKFERFQLHKSVGITILLLSALRLGWRLFKKPPPAVTMPNWQRRAAGVTHWAFYVLLLALPLTGWALVSASPWNLPTLLFGNVPWPHLPAWPMPPGYEGGAQQAARHRTCDARLVHVLLLAATSPGALKHHLVDRDATLSRMLPGLVRAAKGH